MCVFCRLVSSVDFFLMSNTFRNGVALSVSTSMVNLTIGLPSVLFISSKEVLCVFQSPL